MAAVGYARVSTVDQDTAMQESALTQAGCERIFTEHASGAKDDRPELSAALAYLREGDTLVVWKLDRLGRSLKHLIHVVSDLEARGVALRSVTEGIDTGTPGGRLVFHIFGALAEFERALIRERTLAALAEKRANGVKLGRRAVVTPDRLDEAKRMLAGGHHTVASAAKVIGVGRSTLYRALVESGSSPAGD